MALLPINLSFQSAFLPNELQQFATKKSHPIALPEKKFYKQDTKERLAISLMKLYISIYHNSFCKSETTKCAQGQN